jgi:hypothetical protein
MVKQMGHCKPHAGKVTVLLFGLLLGSAGHAANVVWGAVGHSDWVSFGPGYAYNKVPIKRQMQLLTLSGLSWYRTSCVASNCAELVTDANANGIKVLKSIGGKPDATQSEAANYTLAYAIGVSEATNVHSAFDHFEAGNELDIWVGLNGDGSVRGQYNVQRYAQARGWVRGLIDGIHSANASAQVLVDDAGWCHYGFLQMLWADGVRWNITAFHWYSNEGNVEHAGCQNGANAAAIHAAFGLPVWITEFGSKAAATSNDPQAEAAWNTAFIAQIQAVAGTYGIGGVFVYELLDEPNLSGMESHFGIFDGNGNPKVASTAIASALNAHAPPAPLPPTNLQAQ